MGRRGMGRRVVCEAYPAYVNHIRDVAVGESLRPHGGVRATAICGREITQGWDKPNVPVPTSAAEWPKDYNGSFYCKNCAAVLLRESELNG